MKKYLWHRFVFVILRYTAGPIIKRYIKFRFDKQKGPDAPSLVISNHNTDYDPILVAMGFSRHMYFLASEHAFRNGFASRLMKFAFMPIPINKTRFDLNAIKEMVRRLKAGANVCIFAEGDRSFNGLTSKLTVSTAKLVKTSGVDLITYRLEGGYFTAPRWSNSIRRGGIEGKMINRYPAGEIKKMSDEYLLGLIESDIYEDAYERQKEMPAIYRGKNLAESIETALYICPGCGMVGTIKSQNNRFFCGCGLSGEYTETGFLQGGSLPFSTVAQWDIWQSGKLEEIIKGAGDAPICMDEGQRLFLVDPAVGKSPVGEGPMQIDRNAFQCAGNTFPLDQITQIEVVGQRKLQFSVKGGAMYEVQSATPRSALKYREAFRMLTGRR